MGGRDGGGGSSARAVVEAAAHAVACGWRPWLEWWRRLGRRLGVGSGGGVGDRQVSKPTAPSVPSADMRWSFVFLQNGMVVSATTSEDEKGKQIPYYCNRRKERNDRNPARSRTLEATT